MAHWKVFDDETGARETHVATFDSEAEAVHWLGAFSDQEKVKRGGFTIDGPCPDPGETIENEAGERIEGCPSLMTFTFGSARPWWLEHGRTMTDVQTLTFYRDSVLQEIAVTKECAEDCHSVARSFPKFSMSRAINEQAAASFEQDIPEASRLAFMISLRLAEVQK